jgi:hypothetical protein
MNGVVPDLPDGDQTLLAQSEIPPVCDARRDFPAG